MPMRKEDISQCRNGIDARRISGRKRSLLTKDLFARSAPSDDRSRHAR
jgi:hypothetical protein